MVNHDLLSCWYIVLYRVTTMDRRFIQTTLTLRVGPCLLYYWERLNYYQNISASFIWRDYAERVIWCCPLANGEQPEYVDITGFQ